MGTHVAVHYFPERDCSVIKHEGEKFSVSSDRFRVALQQRALEALEESTKMFEVALKLLKQGNRTEAGRIWDEARTLRNDSIYLMRRANNGKLSRDFHGTATGSLRERVVTGPLSH
jgi:hypothetical protein